MVVYCVKSMKLSPNYFLHLCLFVRGEGGKHPYTVTYICVTVTCEGGKHPYTVTYICVTLSEVRVTNIHTLSPTFVSLCHRWGWQTSTHCHLHLCHFATDEGDKHPHTVTYICVTLSQVRVTNIHTLSPTFVSLCHRWGWQTSTHCHLHLCHFVTGEGDKHRHTVTYICVTLSQVRVTNIHTLSPTFVSLCHRWGW